MQTQTRLSATASLSRASGLVVSAALALLAGPASAAVLVNDTFADNERSTQNIANGSLQWFGASSTTTLNASGGNLVIPAVSNSGALAFFTASGSPLVMGVGDTLSMSFAITTPATGGQTGDNSFLYGFIDSGATRPSTDGVFNNGTNYRADTGYFAVAPLAGAHATRNKLVERQAGLHDGLYVATSFSQLGLTAATPNLAPGSTSTFSLSMTLESDSLMTLTSNMGGVAITRSDTTTPLSRFDSVFIFTGGNPAVTVDDVVVSYVAVPEPATLGLLAVVGGAIMLRRRHA